MIDLHIHTNNGDGTESVAQILERAEGLGLEVIAITDHDCVEGYFQLEKMDISKLYSGQILVGCEFTTTFDGYLVEIFGYGFDYKKIKSFLKRAYQNSVQKRDALLPLLCEKIKKFGLEFDFNNSENLKSYRCVYNELARHSGNLEKVPKGLLDNFNNFFRLGYYNPQSEFYLDMSKCYPAFSEIVEEIHKAGGQAFLAHVFEYRFTDTKKMLEKIKKEGKIDGIECYYSNFTENQIEFMLSFAKENNLLVSGGTDYHGALRPQVKLGSGKGNLNIPKYILSNWNCKYFNKKELIEV